MKAKNGGRCQLESPSVCCSELILGWKGFNLLQHYFPKLIWSRSEEHVIALHSHEIGCKDRKSVKYRCHVILRWAVSVTPPISNFFRYNRGRKHIWTTKTDSFQRGQ